MLVSDAIIEAVATEEYNRRAEQLNRHAETGSANDYAQVRADIRRILGCAQKWGFALPAESALLQELAEYERIGWVCFAMPADVAQVIVGQPATQERAAALMATWREKLEQLKRNSDASS